MYDMFIILKNDYFWDNRISSDFCTRTFGNAMMELFLEQFSLEDSIQMPLQELAIFLQKKRRNRFGNTEEVPKSIQKAVKGSYRLSKIVEDSIDFLLSTSIRIMRTYQTQIKEVEKGIESLMSTLPQTLESIPGIGPVFAAEIGPIERFTAETKIAYNTQDPRTILEKVSIRSLYC